MPASDLGRIFSNAMDRNKNQTALKFKKENIWQTMTYGQLADEIFTLSSAMIKAGVKPGDRIGIYSANRYEWSIVDFASIFIGAISVPLFSTNSTDQTAYIIENAGINLIFIGDERQVDQILNLNVPDLRVVSFDPLRDDIEDFLTFKTESVMDRNAVESRLETLTPDKTLTIVYTSGTTGMPKGVMLSHANFIYEFSALDAYFNITHEDQSLCFLPLSHVYERAWSYYIFSKGACNAYLSDPRKILPALSEIKPTVMVSVPRLFEKIYAAVLDAQEKASPLKKYLFNAALKTGGAYHGIKKDRSHISLWLLIKFRTLDCLVLSKIRDIVGGTKRVFAAGGAPLDKAIEEFFFACGLLVCQGYGMTETAPLISFNCPSSFKFGTVGKPLPGCEVKIGNQGEVLVKGAQVMKGYYNDPEATAQAIVDGWLKTGDVGDIDPEGYLRITDRIKELIVTSGGKNVAPQHIETLVGKDIFIEQIIAIGDRRKFMSALVVPAMDVLERWARNNGITWDSRKSLLENPEVLALYRERIDLNSSALAKFETIKKFMLLPNPFTVEAGEITATLKLKRKIITKKYFDLIEAMYCEEPVA